MSEVLPIHIVIDPRLVSEYRLAELLERCADFSPVLQTIGHVLEDSIFQWFTSQGFGTWAPLSAYTIAEKERLGYGDQPPLVREGTLRDGLTRPDAPGHKFLVSPNEVTVGVYGEVVPYAYWLDSGTARMPARALVHATPEAIDKILEIVLDWMGGSEGVRVYADTPLTVGKGDSGLVDVR